jgi:hypothetical protein
LNRITTITSDEIELMQYLEPKEKRKFLKVWVNDKTILKMHSLVVFFNYKMVGFKQRGINDILIEKLCYIICLQELKLF